VVRLEIAASACGLLAANWLRYQAGIVDARWAFHACRLKNFTKLGILSYIVRNTLTEVINMGRMSKTYTISLPPEMAQEVEQVAREEQRNFSELFREAFRTYQQQREIREITRVQQLLGPKLTARGITTEDQVEKLTYEDR
jgi:Arc/MetJ-type ribon-helix-helix transcriptional regulator